MAKSSNSEQESISGEPGSCSGVSLTAAVLTHAGHQEDSIDDNTTTVVGSQQAGGEGDGERGGRKRVPGENGEGEEEEGSGNLLPLRTTGKRRARNSPSKKRESE